MKQIMLGILFLGSLATAGVSTSGGGYAVVCRDKTKSIYSAELLDIVEGRERYQYSMMSASGSAIADYEKSVDNTYKLQIGRSCDFAGCIVPGENYQKFLGIVDWVDQQNQLDIIYDLGDVSVVLGNLKPGCDIEQLAVFNDKTDRVQVARDVWGKLDSLSQAALVQHELWYRHSRNFYLLPETDSEKSRQTTAIIFSKGLLPVMDSIPDGTKTRSVFHDPNRAVNGRYDSTTVQQFQISSSPDVLKNIYRRQYSHIAGRAVLTKTYVDIPQGVNFGEIYRLESAQFKGWYVKIDFDFDQVGGPEIVARLYNDKNLIVTDIR